MKQKGRCLNFEAVYGIICAYLTSEGGGWVYKVAICEDDRLTLEQTRSLCDEILCDLKAEHEISLFSSAEELETVLDGQGDPFHLLILDIKLEKKSGLTLAKELHTRDSKIGVIFMTNYGEYAQEGYDAHPLHFLMKPIDRTRLTEAIKLDLKQKSLPKTITLRSGKRMIALPVKDIHYIESRNHHIYVFGENETHEIRLTLSEVENLLSSQFQRCHASYLVNLEWIREIGKTEITLRDEKKLPMSRTYVDRFKTAYLRYFNTYLS